MMLKIGMELIIEIENVEEIERYKTKVVDLEDETVFIQYPVRMDTNKTAFLPAGRKLSVHFVEDSASAYVFESEVTGRVKRNIPMTMLSYPGDDGLFKIQRREFVRVETAADIALNFPDTGEKLATITYDISAGGCAVVLPRESSIESREAGEAVIVLPMQQEYGYLKTQCRVIRIFEKGGMKLASLQFLNLEESDQQQLIRYCFERQLEQRKKQ